MEAELSIIVPVYNVEKYLVKCLESIVNQTFKDIEIIIVNDGSTDSSLMICEKYSRMDKRIKVINKRNAGLSSARNIGIDLAKGKYIGFVDSDDWIDLDMYELLMNIARNNNADIIICNEKKVINDKIIYSGDTNLITEFTKIEAIEALIDGVIFQEYAWNKIYKKDLFTNIKFPEGKLYEDIFVMYKLFLKSEKIFHIDTSKYYYLQRQGSILNSKFTVKNMDLIEACKERHHDISNIYPHLNEKSSLALLNAYLDIINQIILKSTVLDFKKQLQELRKEIVSILKTNVRFSNLSNKKKVCLLILIFNLKLYSLIIKIKFNLTGSQER